MGYDNSVILSAAPLWARSGGTTWKVRHHTAVTQMAVSASPLQNATGQQRRPSTALRPPSAYAPLRITDVRTFYPGVAAKLPALLRLRLFLVETRLHCGIQLRVKRRIRSQDFLGSVAALSELGAFVAQPTSTLLHQTLLESEIE